MTEPMSRRDIVSILATDPELAQGLAPDEVSAASRALLARVVTLEPGDWEPVLVDGSDEHPAVGLLVLDGLLTRQLVVAGRPSTELLGATDLLRPWDQDGDIGLMPIEVSWNIVTRTRVAVLDRRFLLAASRWPAVLEALIARTLRRSRWLAFQLGMKQIMRVEGRVLVLLWALSERWGVVTPQGVHLRLKLTHEALGKLVGARRPSVTTAIGGLTEAGHIERVSNGYMLYGDAETAMRKAAGEQPAPQRT